MADFRPSKIEVKSRKCTNVLIEEIIISATEATTSSYEINENQKCHWEKCFKEVTIYTKIRIIFMICFVLAAVESECCVDLHVYTGVYPIADSVLDSWRCL